MNRVDLSKIILLDFLGSIVVGLAMLFVFLALNLNSNNFYWGTVIFGIFSLTIVEKRFNYSKSYIDSNLDVTECFSLDNVGNLLSSALFIILTVLIPLDLIYRITIFSIQRFSRESYIVKV